MHKSSRDLRDAHPELVRRWTWVLEQYKKFYPSDPLPQVTNTFRNELDQNRDKQHGASKLSFPHSLHNLYPSWALDFHFVEAGKTSYREEWVQRTCDLVEQAGLFSGRAWGFDKVHVALVEKMSQAHESTLQALPPLPENIATATRLEIRIQGETVTSREVPPGKRLVTNTSIEPNGNIVVDIVEG